MVVANSKKDEVAPNISTRVFARNIEETLARLVQVIGGKNVFLVGGLAMKYHIHRRKWTGTIPCSLEDIDIITKSLSCIPANISDSFVIYHFHRDQKGGYYFALLDRNTKLKIDVFDFSCPPDGRGESYILSNKESLEIVSLERILLRDITDLYEGAESGTASEKQLRCALFLENKVEPNHMQALWSSRHPHGRPHRYIDALSEIKGMLLSDKALFRPSDTLRKGFCRECVRNSNFRLTPLNDVYAMMDRK